MSLNSVLDSILSVLDPRFFRAFKGTKCVLRPESNNYVQRHRFFFQESSGQSRFARYSLLLSRLLQIVTTAMQECYMYVARVTRVQFAERP